MARKHDQVTRLRFLHDGTHCPSRLRESHAPYTKFYNIYGRQGRAGVSYRTLQLPTPAVGMGSADHKTIEAAHNPLVAWQQTQGPRLPSADDGPTEGFVNDIDLAVEIVSYLDDPPSQCPDDLSAGLRERTGGSVISWTTLMITLSRVDG